MSDGEKEEGVCCKFGGGPGCERCGGLKPQCEIAEEVKRKAWRRSCNVMVIHSELSVTEVMHECEAVEQLTLKDLIAA